MEGTCDMTNVRFGIIGFGNMGSSHAAYFKDVPGATLTAICDTNPEKRTVAAAKYPVKTFATHRELLASGEVDAILIAVPHYDHMPIAMEAFEKGIHVLCEKPIAVSVKAAQAGDRSVRGGGEEKPGAQVRHHVPDAHQRHDAEGTRSGDQR